MLAAPSIPGFADLEEIGRGGFGVVYRAHQREFDRQVAIKVLLGTWNDTARSRFEREAVAMGRLSGHPHIVTVYSAGFTEAGEAFLVLPYLSGGSLAERIEEGVLDWEEASVVAAKIAQALSFVHEQQLVHRDVKPDNILFNAFGEPQLGDFGIASVAGMAGTASGVITASVIHAAPEVLDGERATATSDQYSLASTIFEALAGTPAFSSPDDESLAPLLVRIVSQPVPDLRGRGIPDHACAAIERGMAKRAQDRFPTVGAFADALLGGDAVATPPAATSGGAAEPETISYVGPGTGPGTAPGTAPGTGSGHGPATDPEPASGSSAGSGRRPLLLAGIGALIVLAVVTAALGLTWATRDAGVASTPPPDPDPLTGVGGEDAVTVPDVRGLAVDEASDALRATGLRPLVIREEIDGEPDIVFDQEHLGAEVASGSLVRLVVAKEAEVPALEPTPPAADPPPAATDPPPAVPASGVPGLAPGLFCRDLAAGGFDYADAVWYWDLEGEPSRMDATRDGVPCTTVYPGSAVSDYWAIRAQMRALPSGWFCRDLHAAGHTYREAIWYWSYEGRPERMDASRNGRPCQTVYPASAVAEFWGP